VHERQRLEEGDSSYPPTLCHRLDRETSGLVLFARNRSARAEISRQFEELAVRKSYLALVEGELDEGEGTIRLPLGRDPRSRVEIKKGVRKDLDGRPAVTAWRVRQRLSGRTLVELHPRTGRQHQLRAHLAAIGHPIVGDKLYHGGDDLFLRSLEGDLSPEDLASLGHDRQALHAWRLGLQHPATGEPLDLEAPLWPDIAELLARASHRRPGETS
jgi:23S rRNA pseudouridine1911/1915/1917 synthase